MTPAAGDINPSAAERLRIALLMPICGGWDEPVHSCQQDSLSGGLWLGELDTADHFFDPRKDPSLAVYDATTPFRSKSGRLTRLAIDKARQSGMTHLITWMASPPPSPDDMRQLKRAVQNSPDALVIANRFDNTDGTTHRPTFQDRTARFWIRVQTGLSIKDPLNCVRVYPLQMISCLNLRRDSRLFVNEVLVKAAWAGIPIQETALTDPSANRIPCTLPARLQYLVFNVHWTLRSITPIPHRRIVADTAKSGRMISVWHPIRSIRALLTENLSPGQLSAATALGVFLGTLPLIACHSVAILFGANYFRLNKVASLTASQLCMPPIVPALCIETGYYLRHGSFLTEVSLKTLGYQALDRLLEWLLGALLLAPLLAGLAGGLVWIIAAAVSAKAKSGDSGVRE